MLDSERVRARSWAARSQMAAYSSGGSAERNIRMCARPGPGCVPTRVLRSRRTRSQIAKSAGVPAGSRRSGARRGAAPSARRAPRGSTCRHASTHLEPPWCARNARERHTCAKETPGQYTQDSVSEGGLEPPHPCGHQPLKLARLPIPPLRRGGMSVQRRPSPLTWVAG